MFIHCFQKQPSLNTRQQNNILHNLQTKQAGGEMLEVNLCSFVTIFLSKKCVMNFHTISERIATLVKNKLNVGPNIMGG